MHVQVFTCAGGVLFALVAGQPMMITGATGPLLLLDESLAKFCHSNGFDFLTARMYCGLWMIVIALLVASVEGSVAVKKITRCVQTRDGDKIIAVGATCRTYYQIRNNYY